MYVSSCGKVYILCKEVAEGFGLPHSTPMFTIVLMCFLSSLFLHHVDSNCKRMWQRFPLKEHVLVITWIQEERMDDRRTNFLHGFGTSLDSFGSKDILPRWMEKGPKYVK